MKRISFDDDRDRAEEIAQTCADIRRARLAMRRAMRDREPSMLQAATKAYTELSAAAMKLLNMPRRGSVHGGIPERTWEQLRADVEKARA